MSVWAARADLLEPAASAALAARTDARAERRPLLAGGVPLSTEVMTFAALVGNAAVIPVRGLVVNRRALMFWSYEEIRSDLALALAHPLVSRIILDIDSPAGWWRGATSVRTPSVPRPPRSR